MLAQGQTPFGSITLLRERATAQVKLAQAEAALRSSRALLYDTLSEAWERTLTGEPASLKQRANLLLATVNATSSAAQVAELMYSNAGTNGIYMKNPLERHCRDLQVLSNMGSPQRAGSRRSVKCTSVFPPEFAPVML
jgi:alkylation response protein AidB-like acyl-CoA dehydrogenase